MPRSSKRKGKCPKVVSCALSCCVTGSWMRAQHAPPTELPNAPDSATATGTFAAPQIGGNDPFKLAGEPFRIYIVANEDTHPVKHGRGWGAYAGRKLKGEVPSALVLQSPFKIQSAQAFLLLAIRNPDGDQHYGPGDPIGRLRRREG